MTTPRIRADLKIVDVPADRRGLTCTVAIAGLPPGAHSVTVGPVLWAALRRVAASTPNVNGEIGANVEAIADGSVREGLILVRDNDGILLAVLDKSGRHGLPTCQGNARLTGQGVGRTFRVAHKTSKAS